MNEQMIKEELKGLDYGKSVTIKLAKGLKVTVELEADEYPDLSHLGEYSNTPGGVSLERRTGNIFNYAAKGDLNVGNIGRDWERNTYEYFNFESAETLQQCQLDYEIAKQDLVAHVGVVATLRYKGREIGTDSIWGVEYFFTNDIAGVALDNDHCQEVAYECIGEVLAHAGEYDKVAAAVKEIGI